MTTTPEFLPFTRPAIDEETIAGVASVLRSGWLTSGPQVKAFEARLSELCGGRPVRAMSSGTGALEIALALAGVKPGDEVITTPLSWVATANVIVRHGARPVFVDVDPATRNMDLGHAEAAVTGRTRAIMPVDFAGLPVDRDRLYEIARRRHLRVIEDAAQSFGANWRGQPIGAGGDLVAFSFHANKNITTGEGGCLVCDDGDELRRCELLRLQGVQRFPDGGIEVTEYGGKHNLTDIAARIGLGQLDRLGEFTAARRALARRYFALFPPNSGCGLPPADFSQGNWHMFQVTLPEGIDRGTFIAAMAEKGIGVGVHYPAIHLFAAYRKLGYREGDFPVAEHLGRRIVTLPLFPAMAGADVERVCQAVADVIGSRAS